MNDLVRLDHTFEQKKFNWKKLAAPAAIALLVGAGYGAGAMIDARRGPSPEQIAAQAAAATAEKALHAEQAGKKEIADLRAHVEGLKSQLEAQADKARGAEAAIASLQKNLAEEKAQGQALHARLEKLQTPVKEAAHDAAKEAKPLLDRAPTASIAPAAKAAAPVKVAKAVAPKRYSAYVLRDLNDGVAVVEGADGVEEVSPGDLLPGGARVQSFEKRAGGWIVMTDRGFIAPESWE